MVTHTLQADPHIRFAISSLDRLIAILTGLSLVSAPIGALASRILIQNRELALGILGAGWVLAAAGLYVLLRRYQSQPVRQQFRTYQAEANALGEQVRDLQSQLTQLKHRRQVIESDRRAQVQTLKPGYRSKSADLNAMFLGIDQRERDEVEAALVSYQEAFTRSAIADASIRRVRVPGFSARICEKLEEAGILTAVDVTSERLKAVPELEPFLAQELDLWRQRIERDANARKPLHLPAVRLDPIRKRYQEERMAVKASIEGLAYGMQSEVLKIEARFSEQIAQVATLEDGLSGQLGELGKEYLSARERIKPLEGFTFGRYLRACLGI